MNFEVPYHNITNQEDAYKAVQKILTPDFLNSFKVKVDLFFDDSAKKVTARGKGFELNASFLENKVKGNLQLAFLLKPLKNKILGSIESQLKEVL